jgi:hypothetical protein
MEMNKNDEAGKTVEEVAVPFFKIRCLIHLEGPRDELEFNSIMILCV